MANENDFCEHVSLTPDNSGGYICDECGEYLDNDYNPEEVDL